MTELRVDLYGVRIGTLVGERERFDFLAHRDGLERFGVGSKVMSVAVPLLRRSRKDGLAQRRAFFEEVLAEGGVRSTLAGNAKLDADNTLGLLARYGRDTAGALQIWNEADPEEPRTPEARTVTDADVKRMFQEVKTSPLGNSGRRRVSSLAGMQDKVLLVRTVEGWAEPLDGYPSTHIVKPMNAQTQSLIFDEEYGSRFARALGLASFETAIQSFDGVNALVVERFDRGSEGERIHQEDFNQALGLIGDRKYEEPNETDRLRRIADILRTNASASDMQKLLRMTTLSVALRNYDMHGKNIALLHGAENSVELAPVYDVIPSAHLNVDPEFALAINGKRMVGDVTLADVVEEGRSWGLRNPEGIVLEAAEQVLATARSERPHPAAHGGLDGAVESAVSELLDQYAASATPGAAPGAHHAPQAQLPRQAPGGWGGPVR
ncbi:HipA domain-containing protein [Salinibacterium sp. ZJ77]|uniref:type II toxin-antitoxin system HipA family toxin n=1 Tax=Salinibacterium sp. ZJ77 TaxID=2708337 RepID=UPI00141FF582|nr:HipA domain-containing protein [Salinibacterium sp. ZJ77]